MENNSYILIFKNRAVKQLKRKNFANDQRLPFYQALTKIANETVQSLDNQNDKNDIMQFVKRFISNMSRDETLTPQNALKSFEDEVDNNQHLIATTEKNINKLSPKEQQELNNKLFKAVVSGEINAVNEHLNHGANINALDGHANTLLIRAIMNDQTETAKFLIENGVDINKPNCWNETALIRAINEMNSEIALLLIENGADVNPQDYPNTPLSCAIDKKQPEIAKYLIENGADLNALNMIGEPILISAIENKQTDIAKSLIDKGVSLNQVDICKNTPLIKAIYNNQSEIAKLLIEKNVFLDFSNNSGVTPLIASAQRGQIDIVQMLLEKGVDMAQRDKYDKTAYQRLFEYIRNNNISKQDMPVYKKILSQLKEPHSLKNNIKRWLKSIKNEWVR